MALLRRRPKTTKANDQAEGCAHELRDPRWRQMADAGIEQLIDHYICRACGQKLPPTREPDAAER